MAGLVLDELNFALQYVELAETVQHLRYAREAITMRALPGPRGPESSGVAVVRDEILSAIDREIFGPGSEEARVHRARLAVRALAKAAANE